MKTLNVSLRALYAAGFLLLAALFVWYGLKSPAIGGMSSVLLYALLPGALGAYFARSGYRVARGLKAPTSSPAMAVCALALALFGYKLHTELYFRAGLGLLRVSTEGTIRRGLGTLRSALSMYYNDADGRYPAALQELTAARATGPAYLEDIPSARTPDHPSSNAVHNMTGDEFAANVFSDTGGWAYVASGSSRAVGAVAVNCTHTDTRGRTFASY